MENLPITLDYFKKALAGMNTSMEKCGFAIEKVSRYHCEISNSMDSRNVIPVRFDFTDEDVLVMVDRVAEAYEWRASNLANDHSFSEIIEKLLGAYILAEYYGDSKTILRYFGTQGSEIMTSKYVYGLVFFPSKTQSRLYTPILLIDP